MIIIKQLIEQGYGPDDDSSDWGNAIISAIRSSNTWEEVEWDNPDARWAIYTYAIDTINHKICVKQITDKINSYPWFSNEYERFNLSDVDFMREVSPKMSKTAMVVIHPDKPDLPTEYFRCTNSGGPGETVDKLLQYYIENLNDMLIQTKTNDVNWQRCISNRLRRLGFKVSHYEYMDEKGFNYIYEIKPQDCTMKTYFCMTPFIQDSMNEKHKISLYDWRSSTTVSTSNAFDCEDIRRALERIQGSDIKITGTNNDTIHFTMTTVIHNAHYIFNPTPPKHTFVDPDTLSSIGLDSDIDLLNLYGMKYTVSGPIKICLEDKSAPKSIENAHEKELEAQSSNIDIKAFKSMLLNGYKQFTYKDEEGQVCTANGTQDATSIPIDKYLLDMSQLENEEPIIFYDKDKDEWCTIHKTNFASIRLIE